ncbi:methyltransferase regulatory domain-containing protein [Aquifex aeolicus]|uniref:Methyltransferase regulatory domain-containing protein n=1 Tax=Aquifex aeolicus (strain VF5) TaxID=224324 RepID=O67177_AQUAE|nr:methyltransferase regulatory domain-containing protein [Aquifex aeolicus]AAC07140.1 putative protein [Aquifex aeolicus VF5]
MFTQVKPYLSLPGFSCVLVNAGIVPPDLNQNFRVAFFNEKKSLNFYVLEKLFLNAEVKLLKPQKETEETFDFIISEIPFSHAFEEERKGLSNSIRNSLKEKGVLFIEYDSKPGSTPKEEFIRFIRLFLKKVESEQVKTDLEVILSRPSYFWARNNETRLYFLEKARRFNDDFVKREITNENYRIFSHDEVHELLKDCMLSFAGRANLEMNDPEIVLFPSHLATLARCGKNNLCKEAVIDFVLDTKQRRDIYAKFPEVDQEKAIESVADKFFLIPRQSPKNLRREVLLPGGHKLSLSEPVYDFFFVNSEEPRRLSEHPLYEKSKKTAWKAFYRVLSTGEFILCVNDDLLEDAKDELPESFELTPPNDEILKVSFENLEDTYLVSNATKGPAVHLNTLEVILLWFASEKGKTKAKEEAVKFLKSREEFIKLGTNIVKAREVKEEDINKTAEKLFKGRKAFNLNRLKIIRER